MPLADPGMQAIRCLANHALNRIRYHGQKDDIPLVFLREEELRRNQNQPSLIQAEWEEVSGSKKTGRYVLVVQGAVVYAFIYLRYRDMKVFTFDRDPEKW